GPAGSSGPRRPRARGAGRPGRRSRGRARRGGPRAAATRARGRSRGLLRAGSMAPAGGSALVILAQALGGSAACRRAPRPRSLGAGGRASMPLRGLGYLGLASPDLAPWRSFATELLGLMPASAGAAREAATVLRFRMDVRSWRVAVHRAPRAGLAYAGWEAADRDALDEVMARLRAADVAVETPGADERAARSVTSLVRFRDPWGPTHERSSGAMHDFDEDFASPAGVSGFVTENGIGHLLLTVPDFRQAEAFYTRALGLRVTDRMDMGGGKGAVFLRASPRHHSLALTDVMPQAALHHFMLETRRFEDVG